MQISQITLKNFRSFGPEETKVDISNITTFVGSNSVGKTALIQSLQKMFGLSQNERSLSKGDFHTPLFSNNQLESMELFIEVKFVFPELENGENDIVHALPPFFHQLIIESPQSTPYLRMRLTGKWVSSNTPDGEIEQKMYFITVPEEQDITDEDLVPVSPHQRSAIQMIYVPAVREPLTQLKNASGTLLWRIMSNIQWPHDIDQQIRERMEPVNTLFSNVPGVEEIKKIIGEEWKRYHRDYRYQNASLEFNSSSLATILKKIEVEFSPTQESMNYSIDKLGDGLRSLFYLSLVSSLLEVEKSLVSNSTTALTILAVEEPENHMSPHLLGRVMDNLNKIALRENAQVFLSSHSSSIIRRINPEDIRHFRIDSKKNTTIVKKIELPDRLNDSYTYIKEAVKSYPELYFARLVILGEGDSEEIVIPRLLEANGIMADDEGISIVPLGGRHVNHMWKLLNQLEIPHITLLDLDRERNGGGWGRIKYVLTQLLANGKNKESLLSVLRGGEPYVITEKELSQFHKRPLTSQFVDSINKLWLPRLEKPEYNVFFSSPLDLDFTMLESFPSAYKKTVPIGPRFPDPLEEAEEYEKKIKSGIQATLKNEDSEGVTYTTEQHELMVWYNTLFLGRGKPSTHIEALLKLSPAELKNNCPEFLKRMVGRMITLLNISERKEK
ncbi:hypothetical protein D3C76_88840 [compost metagenome]